MRPLPPLRKSVANLSEVGRFSAKGHHGKAIPAHRIESALPAACSCFSRKVHPKRKILAQKPRYPTKSCPVWRLIAAWRARSARSPSSQDRPFSWHILTGFLSWDTSVFVPESPRFAVLFGRARGEANRPALASFDAAAEFGTSSRKRSRRGQKRAICEPLRGGGSDRRTSRERFPKSEKST